MATWGALEVDIYDRSHTLLGTITTAFDCEGSEGIGEKGGGWFRFPASDSAAKTLVQKYRIAVGHSYNDVRAADTIIFCLEILDVQLEKGQPNIIKASGPGRLNELTYDNLAYTLISDGSGGPSTTWQDDVLSTAAQTWTLFTMGTGTSQAYLQAAGESVYDAFVQLSRQNNHAISYNLRQAPARNIWRIVNNSVGSPNPTDPFFNQLELSQPADPSTVESDHKAAVIRDKPEIIEETTEVVTRLYVYGAGMGAGRFTIADADGLISLPAGFTADYTNSVIINSTLEAVTGQPRVVRVEQFSHIKPETDDDTDPNYTAARQTAAIQLVNAGLSYLQERTGDKRIFYEVTAMAHGDYMPGQLVNLDYSDDDYTINDDFVLHKFTHRFDRRTERVSVFLLGEPVYRQKPEFVQVISEKLRRIDETIRHATAFAQSPGVPGSGDAIDQAAFHLAADHPGLPNRRIAADGLGTVYSDGGAGGDVSWDLRTPLSIGMNTANDPGDATTGHTHANDGTLAPSGAGYVVVTLSPDLPNERLAAEGDGISIVDDGFGGGNLTWSVRLDANGGLEFNSAQIRVKLPTNHGLSRSSAGLALGTPGTITGSTANAVTGGSHTHQLSIGATDLPVHVIATNTGLGPQHTISGATAGHVLRASSATAAAFAQLQHGDLGGVTANQHHNQSHVLATTSALGPDHTVSGLTAGQYLRATGSTSVRFEAIPAGDLPTGSTLSVSSSNGPTSHAITSSAAVSTATAVLLATDANGRLRIRGLGADVNAPGNGEIAAANRLMVNDTGDAFVTQGIVVNQGGNDDGAMSFKSSDVVQAMTNFAEADTYFQIDKFIGVEGGVRLLGLTESNTAINLRGMVTNGTTIKSAAALGPILLQGEISDGAGGTTTLGSTRNIVTIRDRGNAVAIFAADGDLYLDTALNENNWDAYDDMALLHGLRAAMVPDGHELRRRFGQFVEDARDVLEATGVVTFNNDGHHFVATKKLQMLTIDALRQAYERLDARLAALEARN